MSLDDIDFDEIEKQITDPLVRMVIALQRQALDESRRQNETLQDGYYPSVSW